LGQHYGRHLKNRSVHVTKI
jgi:fatty acid desaturase